MLSNLDLRFNLDFSSQEEIKLTRWQKVEIPTEYYGLVIGRHEANLLEISKETGAEVTRIRGKVHIIQGTKQQRDHVELLIKRRVVGSLDKFLFPLSRSLTCVIFFSPEEVKATFQASHHHKCATQLLR